jgi:hypothetical protein
MTAEKIHDREETERVLQNGLTQEFRKGPVYWKMKSDIKRMQPDASDFEVDTCIWWYISKPDLFDTQEGKLQMQDLDEAIKRGHYNTSTKGIEQLEEDVFSFRPNLTKIEPESLRNDGWLDSSEAGACTDTTDASDAHDAISTSSQSTEV